MTLGEINSPRANDVSRPREASGKSRTPEKSEDVKSSGSGSHDDVQISVAGRLAEEVNAVAREVRASFNEVRYDRIEDVRRKLQAGTYEDPVYLEAAVGKLIDNEIQDLMLS
ncbi:MAG: flagellar biosynthesis anti-sigma factor FlgM [Planctomycetes bacterium]|nr:flagellar biosynthesis anti-sigma factor FlgM [Planctomycetota bacterium]MCR4318234.1 flagellar biosynthesis anti-sigma factor FlgM [Planctomycetota bacterium]